MSLRWLVLAAVPVACVEVPVGDACLVLTEVSTTDGGTDIAVPGAFDEDGQPLFFEGKGPVRFDGCDPLPEPWDCELDSDTYCPDWFEVCNLGRAVLHTDDFAATNHESTNPFAPPPEPLPPALLDEGECAVFLADDSEEIPGADADCEPLQFTFDSELGGRLWLESADCGLRWWEFPGAPLDGMTLARVWSEEVGEYFASDLPTPGRYE